MTSRTCSLCLLLAAAFPAAVPAQFDPASLLERARAHILENIAKLPKYTCVQAVERSRSEPLSGKPAAQCAAPGSALALAWADRFKVEVTIAGDSEIFSWVGARRFQTADVHEIAGGGLTGSGDFGPFLTSIFNGRAADYPFLGVDRQEGRDLAVYGYRVPAAASRYQIRLGPRQHDTATLAYEGKFWIDPATAELNRLAIVVAQPPLESETCRIETAIEYRRSTEGNSGLLLPASSVWKLWDTDGALHENRTVYEACRVFRSDSVFRPDSTDSHSPVVQTSPHGAPAAPGSPVVPPGITLRIALRSDIDPESAWAGETVHGQLLDTVRGRRGQIILPAGSMVQGRLVRLERHFRPVPQFVAALTFDTAMVNGSEVPLQLESLPRSRRERALAGTAERRGGVGIFMFRDRTALGRATISRWKTAAYNRAGAR